MTIFYSDTAYRGPNRAIHKKYEEQPATLYYLKHYHNVCVLRHISKKTADMIERFKIEKEISIGERKMSFWQKHQNYDQNVVNKLASKTREEARIDPRVAA